MRPGKFDATILTLGFAFLYIPILILVIYSFNESKLVTVWGGFSLKWYGEMWRNDGLMSAAWVTLQVGLLSATLGTILGTLAALTLVRYTRFKGRLLFSGMVYAPLVMPEVITGLSLLLLFVAIGIDRGLMTVVIAHTTFTMCYVAIVVQSRLLTFDTSLEEAAQDLGCPPVKTFFKVTLPLILPGIAAGAILAFAKSMGEFGATITFVSNIPGETQTLASAIYTYTQVPGGDLAAMRLTVISIVLSLGALIASEFLSRRIAARVGAT